MIALLEPLRPAGFVSGGYRYQDAIVQRLVADGEGYRIALAPDRLHRVAADLHAKGERVVVDGLFAELLQAPLPDGAIALLHMVPRQDPWCSTPMAVIATADTTADRVRATAKRVHVVRPGLDAVFTPPATPPCNPRPRIVCVGTICRAKGQHEVVAALADSDCDLVLLGDAREAGILGDAGRARIRVAGCVPTDVVAQELKMADLMVSASRDESFGMAVAEATACGTPVLAFATGEAERWITTGHNGWLLPTTASPASLSTTLRSLLADPSRLAAARAAARRPPLATWDAAARSFATAARSH